MSTVFFSYSHKDEDLRDRLETHLAMLKRQGLIEAWHDRRIVVGNELDNSIRSELEKADIILLLISPDFLASDYCYDVEVKRAMERHDAGEAKVIPIILRHSDWQSAPFGRLLAAPKDGKPINTWADLDEAFLDVVQKIKGALPETKNSKRAPLHEKLAIKAVSQNVRSSNLRLAKTFTEADKDRFLDEGFSFVARFFENSLAELARRNEGIETLFKQIDANRFTAVIYRQGKALARCKIQLGGKFETGISFSSNDRAEDNSYNEMLVVETDDQGLYFKASGMWNWGGEAEKHLTYEGAAEFFWSMLMNPLQKGHY